MLGVMPDDDDQMTREDARHAVLAALHARPTGAFNARMIHAVFVARHGFPFRAIEDACTFLTSAGLLKAVPDGLGATLHYQITADGILAHERRLP